MKFNFTQYIIRRIINIKERKELTDEEIASFVGCGVLFIKEIQQGKIKDLQFDYWQNIIHGLEWQILDIKSG